MIARTEQDLKETARQAVVQASKFVETVYKMRVRANQVDTDKPMPDDMRKRLENNIAPVIRLAQEQAHLTETEILEAIHEGATQARE